MEFLKWVGLGGTATGVLYAALLGLWHIGETTGYRPALKYELDYQGFYLSRKQLLTKLDAGTITEREIGELCGLSQALGKQLPPPCIDTRSLLNRSNP